MEVLSTGYVVVTAQQLQAAEFKLSKFEVSRSSRGKNRQTLIEGYAVLKTSLGVSIKFAWSAIRTWRDELFDAGFLASEEPSLLGAMVISEPVHGYADELPTEAITRICADVIERMNVWEKHIHPSLSLAMAA